MLTNFIDAIASQPGLSFDGDLDHAHGDAHHNLASLRDRNEYKVNTVEGDRWAYHLTLHNTRPRNARLEMLRRKAIQQLYERSIILRRNLVGTGFSLPPVESRFRVQVSGELTSACRFDDDNL